MASTACEISVDHRGGFELQIKLSRSPRHFSLVLSLLSLGRSFRHISFIKGNPVMPCGQRAGNISKAASTLVVEMASHPLVLDDILMYRIISIICQTLFYGQSCHLFHMSVLAADSPVYPTPPRDIFVSRYHLDAHHGVRNPYFTR
jgi:hypothetical protein